MRIIFYKITGVLLIIIALLALVFTNNLFIKFFVTIGLCLIIYFTLYLIFILFQYKKKQINIVYVGDGNIYPFKKNIIELEAKNIPAKAIGVFLSIEFDIVENLSLIHI